MKLILHRGDFIKKIVTLFLIMISTVLLSNCSIESDNSNPYSRENTIDAYLNGYGTDDQEIIACQFVYNSDDFLKLYGSNFEIKNVLCTAEMENKSIMIKGEASCLIYINNDIWCVELTKNYYEKWTEKKYYKCSIDPEDGDIMIDDNGNIVRE